jgi:hypothetical protein
MPAEPPLSPLEPLDSPHAPSASELAEFFAANEVICAVMPLMPLLWQGDDS